MADGPKRIKTWRQLAAEVAQEDDPEKLNKLTNELLRAMEEETRQSYDRVQLATKPHPKLKNVNATLPPVHRRTWRT